MLLGRDNRDSSERRFMKDSDTNQRIVKRHVGRALNVMDAANCSKFLTKAVKKEFWYC